MGKNKVRVGKYKVRVGKNMVRVGKKEKKRKKERVVVFPRSLTLE